MDRDFDIGNIIYLIATIVAVIVGILGKKKKPAAGKSMAEAVFEEYDEQQEEMNAPEPVLEPVQGSVEPQGGLMAEYEKMLAERGLSTDHDFMSEGEISTDPLEVIQLEEEEGLDFLEYIEGFDAARAVVYSAIINRIDY